MNKNALCIPRPGMSFCVIQDGYVDALRHLGWNIYVCDPKTKLGCSRIIEEHNISLIMTHSRYGIRQLPIETINANNVTVLIDVLPLNRDGLFIDSPYDIAHDDEPSVISRIKSRVIHTKIEKHLWSKYMGLWCSQNLLHVPVAGNLVKATPPTCDILTDVAMVANFYHRQNIMLNLIAPLFKRLQLLKYSYQSFGDDIWNKAGLPSNGRLCNTDLLSHIYATAKVCPNVHTEGQVRLQAYINDRSFMIPLCGGIQICDNPLALRYLGKSCLVATSITDFMTKTIATIEDQSCRHELVKNNVKHVADNHTYFSRLVDLFQNAGLSDYADEIDAEGQRMAIRHCWQIDSILSAKERGITYEQETVVGA